MTPRGVYKTVVALSALVAVGCGFATQWAIRAGLPLWVIIAIGLTALGHVLGGYKAWLALHGVTPVEDDKLSFTLKLVGLAISLFLWVPPLWSVLQK